MDIHSAVSYLRDALKRSESEHLSWRARERSAIRAVLEALDVRTLERDNLRKIIEDLERDRSKEISK
jgi:polyhydroxyalkanoate synthesis regulator phasin